MERKPPWWRGNRGEWYVAAQGVLFLLVGFGPRLAPGLGPWSEPYASVASVAGSVLLAGGGTLSIVGLFWLGPHNLTPLPYPRPEAILVTTGPYAIVRNPIYSGLIAGAYGWALLHHSWPTVLFASMLLLFFDIKTRREERWLCEKFPEYDGYQQRVRKLIPWLY